MADLHRAVDSRVYVSVGRGLWDCASQDVYDYLEGLQEGLELNKVQALLVTPVPVCFACEFSRETESASLMLFCFVYCRLTSNGVHLRVKVQGLGCTLCTCVNNVECLAPGILPLLICVLANQTGMMMFRV